MPDICIIVRACVICRMGMGYSNPSICPDCIAKPLYNALEV